MTPGVFRIEVECSSGTYVRVLAADLGAALGGGAHLRNLRRTRIGSFTTEDARLVDELTPAVVPHPGPGHARPRPGGGAARRARSWWPGPPVRPGPARGVRRRTVGPGRTTRHHLLAVYEATETDRIKPAVVVESGGLTG